MSISRVKTWSPGEILTASDLNSEFNNILNNALSLVSPVTGNFDLDGNVLILDSDGDTSITADTDDQIDIAIAGADDFQFTANIFTALAGSKIVTPGLEIQDTSADHQYVFAVNELAADRTITLPLLTGNDTFVFDDFAATLTNKTIDSASNTLTLDLSEGTLTGTTAAFNTALSDGSFATLAGSETLTNKTITAGTLGGTTNLTGGQIAFPASQSASADANTLDDYEEGTWTPAITFGTAGDISVAYSAQSGSYTKVGNLVTARFRIETSSFTHSTASGNFLITGLPFTIANTTSLSAGAIAMSGWTKTGISNLTVIGVANQTYLNIYASGSGISIAILDVNDVPTAGTVIIYGTVSFTV